MKTCRIHITGASGAGVTTLGRALADALAVSHADTDDYFWQPTDPPFQHSRDKADRLRLMHEMFVGRAAWVLSGSLDRWGDPLIPQFDLVVFLTPRKPRACGGFALAKRDVLAPMPSRRAAGGIEKRKTLST